MEIQANRLRQLLTQVATENAFYAKKWLSSGIRVDSIQRVTDLRRLPFTTKAELIADQERNPPYGTALTFPASRYTRLHQTSGTSGQPLRWLDTPESWHWLLGCWDEFFRIMDLKSDDRLLFAFSFGPFLGFWSAFEAAVRRGNLCLPAGGLSSVGRLRFLLDNQVTVVLCTPTYALHLAEVARKQHIDLSGSAVRALILAGEPGASIPATRQRIENSWGARVFDHNGLTEVGAVGIECVANPAGLHLLESEYIAEVVDPQTTQPTAPGYTGELVLTNLGRAGSPVIRYRTGDLVCVDPDPCPCGNASMRLKGGILGRTDDMIHLRGNNVYPSALENIIRRFAEIAEYRIEVDETGALTELKIQVEPMGSPGDLADRVEQAIRDALHFRAEVVSVPPGSLPRFEMKARRVEVKRKK